MTDCKCRHGKKEHEWNRDARARIGKCTNRNRLSSGALAPCGCERFTEATNADFFKEWEETIRTLRIRKE